MFLLPFCSGKVLPRWPGAGTQRMRRIWRSGDNRAFIDPLTEFNVKREKTILDKEAVMKTGRGFG
jgi:hypothetical protein